jgi:hypothetical protein
MRGQKRVEDARRRAGVPRIHVFAAEPGRDNFNLSAPQSDVNTSEARLQ